MGVDGFTGVWVVEENEVDALVVSCAAEVELTVLVESRVEMLVEPFVEPLVEVLFDALDTELLAAELLVAEILVELRFKLVSIASSDQPSIFDNSVVQASTPVKEGA